MAPTRSRAIPLAIAVIVGAGVLTYAGGLSHAFIFDDIGTITRNPGIRDLGNWRAVLIPAGESPIAGRPLASASLALNYAFGGLNVGGYRAVNLAIHLLCGVLIFGLVRRTLERMRPASAEGPATLIAGVSALLWTVHPLNSEVVNYVTERTESLMAACYLLTMYAAVRALDSARPARWQATAVAACAAGMASKESMVTAPLMLVLYDWTYAFGSLKEAMRARGRFYAAVASTWLLLVALLLTNTRTASGGFATAVITPWEYLLNQTVMITRYVRLSFWPDALVLYYGWARSLTLADVWPYAAFVTMLFLAAFAAFFRRPKLGFLGVWVFITLSPASSLVPVASEVGAERRMYLPLAGLVVLVVVGLTVALSRMRQLRALPAIAGMVAIALGATSVARTREYASALGMAHTVLERWPSPIAHHMVGTELASAGRHDDAIQHFRKSVTAYPPARFNLGTALLATGRQDEALRELERFIKDEPTLVQTGDAHGLIAITLTGRQRYAEAIPHYRAFLNVRPDAADSWNGLGVASISTGSVSEAIAAFQQAVTLQPGNAQFRANLERAKRERR